MKISFMRNNGKKELGNKLQVILNIFMPCALRKFSHENRWRSNFLISSGSGFQSPTALRHYFFFFLPSTFVLRVSWMQNSEPFNDYTGKLHCKL